MIIVVSKVQTRRGLQSQIPGAPISSDPPSFAPGLDEGEIAMSTDTGRLFIGHSPTSGNQNFNRVVFPYQNVEVLTENSPRNGELFSQFMRDQDRNDFYVPTTLASGSGFVPLMYTEYDGGIAVPAKFYGSSVSATVEYHAFQNNAPVKQGTLRILAAAGSQTLVDDSAEKAGGPFLDFQIGAQQSDAGGYYYQLNAWNRTGAALTIIIRRTIVVGLSA